MSTISPVMNELTPTQLKDTLKKIVSNEFRGSVMVWGPAGIGKSSIVAAIAKEAGIGFTDLRLSQLAPTDLRGVPVPDMNTKTTTFFAPAELPRSGKGILFLDEMNMAPPTLQGIAQQLILDRKVGSYCVPDGWFVWAAGNRKSDKATVFDLSGPMANRFIHLSIRPDADSFHEYAAGKVDFRIAAFLKYRPQLLHCMSPTLPAWPSPRSWMVANELLNIGVDISHAIGEAAGREFAAFSDNLRKMPDLSMVIAGQGGNTPWPEEPSVQYAVAVGLAYRGESVDEVINCAKWLSNKSRPEWLQMYCSTMMTIMRAKNLIGHIARAVQQSVELREALANYQKLLGLNR